MTVFTLTANKDDGEPHDVCPTCGGHAETNAQTDASGHTYRLTCRVCSWSVPLTRPPTAARDDARLVTDGGTPMEYVAECETCGIVGRGDREAAGDAAEAHEQFHDVQIKRIATDGGQDYIASIESYGDLARRAELAGREVDIVAGQLADGPSDEWLICWLPQWLLAEKRDEAGLQPVAGAETIVAGSIEAETAKAFLVEADGGEAWLPKSVITRFVPADGMEMDIPQRGLGDYERGEAA